MQLEDDLTLKRAIAIDQQYEMVKSQEEARNSLGMQNPQNQETDEVQRGRGCRRRGYSRS